MKVKNPWVLANNVRVLNQKLNRLFVKYSGQEYTENLKKAVQIEIKQFLVREKLSSTTSFLIQLEKQISNSGLIVQVFKGVKVVDMATL